jgi:hypothetical protein
MPLSLGIDLVRLVQAAAAIALYNLVVGWYPASNDY